MIPAYLLKKYHKILGTFLIIFGSIPILYCLYSVIIDGQRIFYGFDYMTLSMMLQIVAYLLMILLGVVIYKKEDW